MAKSTETKAKTTKATKPKTEKTDMRPRRFRYPSEPNTLAMIELEDKTRIAGLVLDESFSGCAVVLRCSEKEVSAKDFCKIAIGSMAPLRAEIVWTKTLDAKAKVIKAGVAFLE